MILNIKKFHHTGMLYRQALNKQQLALEHQPGYCDTPQCELCDHYYDAQIQAKILQMEHEKQSRTILLEAALLLAALEAVIFLIVWRFR